MRGRGAVELPGLRRLARGPQLRRTALEHEAINMIGESSFPLRRERTTTRLEGI